MNGNDWMRDITAEMLPTAHKQLADVIGVEAALKLCETYGGLTLYVPKTDAVLSVLRNRRIRAEFNGENTALLARRYGLTTRSIQIIVQGCQPQPIPGQTAMDL